MSKLFDFKYEKKNDLDANATLKPQAEETEPDTAGETETFLTRNVRLITFLICIAVFLAIFGPISIFRIAKYIEENRDDGEAMSVETVVELSARHEKLRLSDFKNYEKTVSDGDDTILYFFTVEENYLVMVGAESKKGMLTCFTVTDSRTDETVDVMAVNFSLAELQALLED